MLFLPCLWMESHDWKQSSIFEPILVGTKSSFWLLHLKEWIQAGTVVTRIHHWHLLSQTIHVDFVKPLWLRVLAAQMSLKPRFGEICGLNTTFELHDALFNFFLKFYVFNSYLNNLNNFFNSCIYHFFPFKCQSRVRSYFWHTSEELEKPILGVCT